MITCDTLGKLHQSNKVKVKIGIIEDHADFRKSLSFLLSSTGEFTIAWAVESAEKALKIKDEVSIILLDINLPSMSGIQAIPFLKSSFPGSRIIMLTILEDDENIFNAIRQGADGYLLKKSDPFRIMEAIRQVNEGGGVLTPSVAKQVLNHFKSNSNPVEAEYHLTLREKEVLGLVVNGISTERIASTLYLSEETVRNHIRHIYEKLQVHTRAQAVAKALRERLT